MSVCGPGEGGAGGLVGGEWKEEGCSKLLNRMWFVDVDIEKSFVCVSFTIWGKFMQHNIVGFYNVVILSV